jgi:sarcosine oxidase
VGAPIAAEALELAGESFEWLAAEAAAERWPAMRPPGGPLLFQGEAGVCRAGAAVAAQARLAGAAGATIAEETRVTAVTPAGGDDVDVATATGHVHRAPVVVVTAGGWAEPLLATAGVEVPLRVTRETVVYGDLPDAAALPTLIEWGDGTAPARYCLPVTEHGGSLLPGTRGTPYGGRTRTVKVGEHRAGAAVDPDSPASTQELERGREALAGAARERFAVAAIDDVETCLYTNTADEDFVLDRVGPVVVGSPCSGHGFKFAPLIGRILADLATGAGPPVPLGRFAWDRPSLRPGRP